MLTSMLRVESDFAIAAHHDQVRLWLVVKERSHSGQVKVGSFIDATARRASVLSLSEHLGSKALSLRRSWWRSSKADKEMFLFYAWSTMIIVGILGFFYEAIFGRIS